MPPMPYTLEIGRVFSWLTDYLETPTNQEKLLEELRNNYPLSQITAINSPHNPLVPDASNPPQMISPILHIERDWFGQPPSNPLTTGWWTNWTGDAEGITRETIRCAVEIALGVPHHDVKAEPTRHWRMNFLWACGAPFFQGWVSWQSWDDEPPPLTAIESTSDRAYPTSDRSGIVTTIFTTPGNGHPLYATPERPRGAPVAPPPPPPVNGAGDYEDPAWRDPYITDDYGLWLIGQKNTQLVPSSPSLFNALGDDFLPHYAIVKTSGDVVVVAPAEIDGGVLKAGREW